jgi:hypothetical protein
MIEWERRTSPISKIHRRYNEAAASVTMLERLIAIREAGTMPCDDLRALLRDAKAKREAARAELEAAGMQTFLARD